MKHDRCLFARVRCVASRRRLAAALTAVVLLLDAASSVAAQSAADWPQVRLPEGVSIFPIGDRMTIGGMPMHVVGFVSPMPPGRLLGAMRQSLGQPLVESVSQSRPVLGRAEGRFYITVQVTASGEGSRGIVSVADRGPVPGMSRDIAAASRWLERLPSGSSITSNVSSEDAGKSARHLVVTNGHAESVNRDAVMQLMQQDGFRLERETRADAAIRRDLPAQFADATALYFTAPSKQAVAVIVRENGRTALILNTITDLQAMR